MKHTLTTLASLAAFALLGCSSSSGGGGGPGGGSGACGTLGDVCKIVPLETFEATCGTTAANAITGNASDSGEGAGCTYVDAAAKQVGLVGRVCYPTLAEATATFEGEHDSAPIPDRTQSDVAGVGDGAFYREDFSLGDFDLHVLQGQSILVISDHDRSTTTGKKDCLVSLANMLLAAK